MNTAKQIAIDAFVDMYNDYVKMEFSLKRDVNEIDMPSKFVFVCAGDLENMCRLFNASEHWSQLQSLGAAREEVLDWLMEEADVIITYDVVFEDGKTRNCMFFRNSVAECYNYIRKNNGILKGYFGQYQFGKVKIVNTITDECVWWGYVY